ncbi:MAG: DUF5615 family PIN-like protein [Candidatus Solibacter usitatus]|nr:DUF5615 family PIN-like protein [Candidatus Solibacter usitatus]
MRFLVDNQLPAALARFLASRGVDCQHVLDVDLADASDTEIWEHASRNDIVVISKGEDFLYLAGVPGARARLIWIRLGNSRTKALLSVIELLWPRIEAALKAGDQVIEVR